MKKISPWTMTVLSLLGLLLVMARPWRWFDVAESTPTSVGEAPPPLGQSASTVAPHELVASAPTAKEDVAQAPGPELAPALIGLIGTKAFHALFLEDDLSRRVVATVDNLGRDSAPASLWPVVPAEGRFETRKSDGPVQIEFISAANAARYAPHVLLLETISLPELVRTYRAVYPLLQRSHAELGLPQRSFHVRLLDVLDLLSRTPEPPSPVAVVPPDIRGPIQPLRPWVLYAYADPDLESLTAGQKILLRMDSVQRKRVLARLSELRTLLAAAGQP